MNIQAAIPPRTRPKDGDQRKQTSLARDLPQAQTPHDLAPSKAQLIREDLLANSLHFPLANLLFEYFFDHGGEIFSLPETYALLLGALLQATVLGSLRHSGRPFFLLANLIGPAVYVGFEFLEHGLGALQAINHQIYFAFALAIGLLQQLQFRFPVAERPLLVLETTVRTSFILAMYALFQINDLELSSATSIKPDDISQHFIVTSVLFLGLLLGIGNVTARQQLNQLTLTARRLHDISVWSWGSTLVSRVVKDPRVLRRHQVQRFILFLDIRDFTAWCDRHPPEEVLFLLNRTFDAMEKVWRQYPVVLNKLTGDELMLVVDEKADALKLAEELRSAAEWELSGQGLGAGVGVHFGPVIEGLVGGQSSRIFDVLGDSVNVASRLCSAARRGECLITEEALLRSSHNLKLPRRTVEAKGKAEPIQVWVSA